MPIELTVVEKEAPKPIPEQLYKAVVKEITEGTGEFGEYLRFTFEITEGEYSGTTRTAVASKKLSKTKTGKASKLLDFVKAIVGAEPKTGEVLDVESLVGKSCQILVENDTEKDGIVFQRVTKVMPS